MRDYPKIYSQRDPAWSGQRLGTVDGITIGQYGCILTCQSMKASYYGHSITPNALDDIFTNSNIYINGDLLPDTGVVKVFPDIQLIETHDFSSVPADLDLLHKLSQDESITVTIEVDFDHDSSDGIQTHFVELHSYDGTTLTIYDPWYGTSDNFTLHYGNDLKTTILKYAVYKGKIVDSIESQLSQSNADRDTNYNLALALFNALGVNLDPNDKEDSKQKGVQAINDLKTQHDRDAQTIIDLKTIEEKMAGEDRNYAQEVLNAQHKTDDIIADRKLLYNKLGVTTTSDAINVIDNLQKPHEEVVKQVVPIMDKLAEAAIYKKPPTVKPWYQSILDFFKRG